MKVQIAFSTHDFTKNSKYVSKITQTVRNHQGTILVENFEAANARINSSTKNTLDWDAVLKLHMQAFKESDLFIIEGSTYGFSNGFWSAFSLLTQKPTLFLYQKNSEQLRNMDDRFITGLMSDTFIIKAYESEDDLEKIVSDFIMEFNLPKKKINLEVDQVTDSYLDKISKSTGRQKSEIIKDILNREIRKEMLF